MSRNAKNDGMAGQQRQQSFMRGTFYLVGSIGIIVLLGVVIPQASGVDIRSLMQGDAPVGLLRALLGIAIIAYALHAVEVVVRGNTLDGETWTKGLSNALHSTLLGLNGLTIVLMLVAGIALVAWGISGILE